MFAGGPGAMMLVLEGYGYLYFVRSTSHDGNDTRNNSSSPQVATGATVGTEEQQAKGPDLPETEDT